MKGKKLVFAVILSLIVCLLLVPSAYADTEEQPTENNSATQMVDTTNTDTDGDNGGSDNDSQNNESTDKPADSGDSESKNDSDNDSTSDDEGQSGVNDGSSDESENNTTSDDTDTDTDTDKSDNDTASEEEESNTDSEEKEQENASEEETETDTAPSNPGDSNLPPQPDYTGFQVELTYNGKVVKMNGLKGGESHDFAQLMKELGIEGEVESAIGDADDLFTVTSDENGMHFNTLMAFETKQKLVVTVGGVEYVIIVTDDGAVQEVGAGDDLQDKITNAANGTIIKLKADFTGAFVIPEGKTITIDLNGKTLTGNGEIGDDYLYKRTIYNKGTLTIKDSVGTGKVTNKGWHNPAILNTGNLTIEGGEYSTSGGTNEAWYVVKNLGTMTINGGTFTKDTKDTGLVVNGFYGENGGTANDHGINYTGTNAQLTINGGMFKNGAYSVKNELHAKLKITGGTFTDARLYNVTNESTAEIKGGTFNSQNNNIWSCNNGKGNNGTITISDGNFTVADNKNSIVLVGATNTTIKGGTFNGGNLLFPGSNNANNGGNATINGGTFNVKNMTSLPVEDWTGMELVIDIKEELTAEEAPANTITLANDAPVIKYWVVEGKDQTWTKSGNESIVFTLNSSAVTKVLVDGVEVEFELDEDGKIVISAEVLEALEAGEHTVEFIFADGNCKTNIIIK